MRKMLLNLLILFLTCYVNSSCARPAEEPTKFTFNITQNNTGKILTSTLEQGKELLGRAFDAIRIARGRFVNTLILARNILADQVEQIVTNEERNNHMIANINSRDSNQKRRSLTVQTTTPIILFRPMTRETAYLEHENEQRLLEKRKPDNIRQVLNSFLQPTPIVDGAKEEVKYQNSGNRFAGISKFVINGYENFSNLLNNIVEYPVIIAKQTSRGITQVLNELGARIVGLQ